MKTIWRRPRIRGVNGLGVDPGQALSDTVSVDPSASISADFNAMVPGTYQVAVTAQRVHLGSPTQAYYDPGAWNDALAAQGVSNVRVTQVAYVGQSAASSTNSAADLLDNLFASDTTYAQDSSARAVADFYFVITVVVSAGAGSGMSGLGLAPLAIAGIVLVVVAGALALIDTFAGTNFLVTACRKVGAAVGALASGAVKPVAEAAGSLLFPVVLIGGIALYFFVKAGGRGKFKGFSIGGKS